MSGYKETFLLKCEKKKGSVYNMWKWQLELIQRPDMRKKQEYQSLEVIQVATKIKGRFSA